MNEGPPGMEDVRPGARQSAGADVIYRNVLDNVASGVMSLDTQGTITSFNAAASEITGLAGEAAVGRTFVEVFSHSEGTDAFTDVIFDAVYDSSMIHQRVVEVTLAGKTRSLSVATRYLSEERDGETVRIGVVAVFSDITEIRELRESEVRLAKEVEAKHAELREAWLDLEETNRQLGRASKRIGAFRTGAAALVLAAFALAGLYVWDAGPIDVGAPSRAAPAAQEQFSALVVQPAPISFTVTMVGRLAPRREVEVTSPIKGKVAEVHVLPGEWVVEGQRLVEMDVTEVEIEYREAQVAHIRARDRVEEIEAWSDNPDVSRARRAVSKSRIALEARKNRLAETTFLLKRGIIPASEHEAAEREHHNQRLDLESAEQALRAVLAKGAEEREVAELEFENARARLERVERTLKGAVVTSPATGVVMHPKRTRGERGGRSGGDGGLAKGSSVEQGERLLTIGDLDGLTVVGNVDEVDVARIRPGQPARIVGDAFPGVVLSGKVVRVSSQALAAGNERRLPFFEVAAVVENLTEDQRGRLRLGMSARIDVVVYEKADALLVPIEAVDSGAGQPRLLVRDRDTGEVRPVEVVAGMTTLDSVEIVEGISAGDVILIAGR